MLALSMRQPWAELLMQNRKDHGEHDEFGTVNVEYRSRATKVRGRIYIYASLGRGNKHEENEWGECFDLDMDSLPRGVIVGTVDLVGCDDDMWYLRDPQRLSEPVKPKRRANPVWFYPFERDVPEK